MAATIQTNIMSLNTQRHLSSSQNALQTSMERLSSGLRINGAKDDAAGLAISERFSAQIRGLDQAVRNANDGISYAQTVEGALSTVTDAMQRIRELAVQSANDTNTASDRQALNDEVRQLVQEIDRVASATQFNGQNILDGSLSNLVFQVGANAGQTISVNGVDTRASQLGAEILEGVSYNSADLATVAGNLDINGTTITGVAGAQTQQEVIAAINAVSADTGVTAQAATSLSSTYLAADLTFADTTLGINGVNIEVAATDTAAILAQKINDVSNLTGVTASESAGDLTLANNDGTEVSVVDGSDVLGVGGDHTLYGGIDLLAEIDTAITVAATADATALGLTGTAAQESVQGLDVLDRAAAGNTIVAVDYALGQINGLRSEFGAIQNRFTSTIENLTIASENMSAARSRIRDTDFAAETAALTRAQILQQAGTAMLAQANAQPQGVLALLQ